MISNNAIVIGKADKSSEKPAVMNGPAAHLFIRIDFRFDTSDSHGLTVAGVKVRCKKKEKKIRNEKEAFAIHLRLCYDPVSSLWKKENESMAITLRKPPKVQRVQRTFYEWTEERLNGSIDFEVDFADNLKDHPSTVWCNPPSSKDNEHAVRVGVCKRIFDAEGYTIAREYCYFLRVTQDGRVWRHNPICFSESGYEFSQNGSKVHKRLVRELDAFLKANSIEIAGAWVPSSDLAPSSSFRRLVATY